MIRRRVDFGERMDAAEVRAAVAIAWIAALVLAAIYLLTPGAG